MVNSAPIKFDPDIYKDRWDNATDRLGKSGFDGVVICGGADMSYLCGYHASSYERITALIAALTPNTTGSAAAASPVNNPASATGPSLTGANLVVPKLELALLAGSGSLCEPVGYDDDQFPLEIIAAKLSGAKRVAVSDELWSQFLLGLKVLLPDTEFICLSDAVGGLRSIKSATELDELRSIGAKASSVAEAIQNAQVDLVGRSEADVAQEITRRLLEAGHETVEFCIVASGPNAASPHHGASEKIIEAGEIVLFDFGGRSPSGYCSDITRCVFTGAQIPDEIASAYETLKSAHAAAFANAGVGTTLGAVDSAARDVITEAGLGQYFIHRTGHGIGTQVHEQPWVKAGNTELVELGHAFSIEPGIYVEGKWGMRLEDIVVVTEDGAIACSDASRDLIALG